MLKNVLVASALMIGGANAANLNIDILDVENTKGHIVLAVYKKGDFTSSKSGPPPAYADKQPAAKGTVDFAFKDVAPGDYTFVVFHDENDNEDVDTNWIGLPKEGIAFSNDAQINMGPPKEKDMLFTLGEEQSHQSVRMGY